MTLFNRLILLIFSAFLLNACATVKVGQDFDVGVFVSKIEHGVSTQAAVRSWLGEPSAIGISLATDGERFDEWSYYYAEGDLPDMRSAKIKMLQIKFDKQGKVRGYNWSASQ